MDQDDANSRTSGGVNGVNAVIEEIDKGKYFDNPSRSPMFQRRAQLEEMMDKQSQLVQTVAAQQQQMYEQQLTQLQEKLKNPHQHATEQELQRLNEQNQKLLDQLEALQRDLPPPEAAAVKPSVAKKQGVAPTIHAPPGSAPQQPPPPPQQQQPGYASSGGSLSSDSVSIASGSQAPQQQQQQQQRPRGRGRLAPSARMDMTGNASFNSGGASVSSRGSRGAASNRGRNGRRASVTDPNNGMPMGHDQLHLQSAHQAPRARMNSNAPPMRNNSTFSTPARMSSNDSYAFDQMVQSQQQQQHPMHSGAQSVVSNNSYGRSRSPGAYRTHPRNNMMGQPPTSPGTLRANIQRSRSPGAYRNHPGTIRNSNSSVASRSRSPGALRRQVMNNNNHHGRSRSPGALAHSTSDPYALQMMQQQMQQQQRQRPHQRQVPNRALSSNLDYFSQNNNNNHARQNFYTNPGYHGLPQQHNNNVIDNVANSMGIQFTPGMEGMSLNSGIQTVPIPSTIMDDEFSHNHQQQQPFYHQDDMGMLPMPHFNNNNHHHNIPMDDEKDYVRGTTQVVPDSTRSLLPVSDPNEINDDPKSTENPDLLLQSPTPTSNNKHIKIDNIDDIGGGMLGISSDHDKVDDMPPMQPQKPQSIPVGLDDEDDDDDETYDEMIGGIGGYTDPHGVTPNPLSYNGDDFLDPDDDEEASFFDQNDPSLPIRSVVINDEYHDNATQALTSSLNSRDELTMMDDNQSLYQRDEFDPNVMHRVMPSHHSGHNSISGMSNGLRSHRSGHNNNNNNNQSGTRSVADIRSERQERLHWNSANSNNYKKNANPYQYAPPLDMEIREKDPPGAQMWRSFCMIITCWMPDMCIRKKGAAAKLAWREKATIVFIFLLVSVLIVGGMAFLPIYLCQEDELHTLDDVRDEGNEMVAVFGKAYNVGGYIDKHPGGSENIRYIIGQDASRIFPRLPTGNLPEMCLNLDNPKSLNLVPSCDELTQVDKLRDVRCHLELVGMTAIRDKMQHYLAGDLVYKDYHFNENGFLGDREYILIDSSVYDVTTYLSALKDNTTGVISQDSDHPGAYLVNSLHSLIINKVNEDATELFNDVFTNDEFRRCLDEMFYVGRIDSKENKACDIIQIFIIAILFAFTGLMGVQVLCSLMYLARRIPNFKTEDMAAAVLVLVPCYNESDSELRKTIDSVLMNDYPEENKVMMVVADGVITGKGEPCSTPETLGRILGFTFEGDDEAYEYQSIGKKTQNFASVYSGTYEKRIGKQCRSLKYMVVVKQGAADERGTPRAGNRGKRDSQLLLAHMLNRLHYNREPLELDVKVKQDLDWLGVPLRDIEYLMAIDADTRVADDAVKHMVYSMERNPKTLACCGETQVDNKGQTWVTMIQVFEYFSSHHMKKAFESVFGCVTCLPGCFTMYRLYTSDMDPLVSSDIILSQYSRNDISSLHEKNLFELGEDRMLTTLLLQNFAGMHLQFVPEAVCWTIVPHTYSILLSQRRRWINSTLHNMFELLKVKTMCGICCCSMKSVVVCDIISTLILPASIVYLVYLIVTMSMDPNGVDPMVMYFFLSTILMTMLPFLFRARWDYLLWFIIYTVLGIPVFYLILPVYSVFHMDDFGWGKTREVAAAPEAETKEVPMGDVENYEENEDGNGDDNDNDNSKNGPMDPDDRANLRNSVKTKGSSGSKMTNDTAAQDSSDSSDDRPEGHKKVSWSSRNGETKSFADDSENVKKRGAPAGTGTGTGTDQDDGKIPSASRRSVGSKKSTSSKKSKGKAGKKKGTKAKKKVPQEKFMDEVIEGMESAHTLVSAESMGTDGSSKLPTVSAGKSVTKKPGSKKKKKKTSSQHERSEAPDPMNDTAAPLSSPPTTGVSSQPPPTVNESTPLDVGLPGDDAAITASLLDNDTLEQAPEVAANRPKKKKPPTKKASTSSKGKSKTSRPQKKKSTSSTSKRSKGRTTVNKDDDEQANDNEDTAAASSSSPPAAKKKRSKSTSRHKSTSGKKASTTGTKKKPTKKKSKKAKEANEGNVNQQDADDHNDDASLEEFENNVDVMDQIPMDFTTGILDRQKIRKLVGHDDDEYEEPKRRNEDYRNMKFEPDLE
mmetsp:Transcript_10251/g.29218  ORF Transcript_10251/g.29218 Transcript_10251/m.29218 type:complete len:2089 (+) Transcript_10251:609-6875(+)